MKIENRRPGRRLWENDDVRIDRGEDLADGSINIVWQKQSQTKNQALRKIKSTHEKIVTQRVFRNSKARDLVEDVYTKLG